MLSRPVQPQFKIRVFNGKRVQLDTLKGSNVVSSSDGTYIDIEPCVSFPVTYEEQASLLNTLSFVVGKNADLLLYYFFIGQGIIFYGGYYSDSQISMRHVFSGTVTRIRTSFTDSGEVSFSVECMSYGYTKLGKDPNNYVYPDKLNGRNFAKVDSISLEEVIRGIASENKIEVGEIDLSADARKFKMTKDNIRYQKNMTDWQFLCILASDFGCVVWMDTENGSDRLHFVSDSKASRKQNTEISFLYPLLNRIVDIKDTEMQTFSDPAHNRPRLLRNVTVDEDVSMAYAVTRSAMYFDKDTGEYKEAIAVTEEDKDGKTSVTFYELDEQRVEYVHQNLPDIADKIREGSPTSLPWGTPDNPKNASYYYKVIKKFDEQVPVFDKAFYGITLSATCNQDLDIRSQRNYRVRGILSYHSKDLETSFFLRGLKHIWASDGTWTELDFIR